MKNDSETNVLENVTVVEEIPKSLIALLTEADITANVPIEILQADPIVEFTIPEIGTGNTAEVVYSLAEKAGTVETAAWKPAVVAELEEYLDLCIGINCTVKECKKATCVSKTGECVYTKLDDGTDCSIGICEGGECVVVPEEPIPTPPIEEEAPVDNTLRDAAIFIIILIAGYFLVLKKKPKSVPLAGKSSR